MHSLILVMINRYYFFTVSLSVSHTHRYTYFISGRTYKEMADERKNKKG